MEYLIIILFYVLFGVLAWKNFKLTLYSVFLLLPAYRVQFEVFGLPFNLLSGIIWILVLVFFLKNIKKIPYLFKNFKKNLQDKENIFQGFRWPIILILISAYIATFIAPDSIKALGLFKAYFLESLFFFILLVFSLRAKDIKNCIYFLQTLAFLIFGVALYQKLSGSFIFNTTNIIEQSRVTTFFGYPNANGLLLLPIFFLVFINLLTDKKLILKIFNVLTLIFSLIVIYWARSESALIAIIVGLILFVLFKLIKNKKFILIISLLIILTALAVPFMIKAPKNIDLPDAYQYTWKQKVLMQDLSGQIRRQMWHETIDFLKDNPFFGSGLVGYQSRITEYHKFDYVEIYLYPHNIFLNFWVSLGIFGLLGFLWLTVLLIAKLVESYKVKSSKESLILLIVFLAIIIQGIVEVPYFKNDLAIIFWFIIAGYLIYNKKFDKV